MSSITSDRFVSPVSTQSFANGRPITIYSKWTNQREKADELRIEWVMIGSSSGKHGAIEKTLSKINLQPRIAK